MHDVIVTYSVIPEIDAFTRHYLGTHVPLVRRLPELEDFSWGLVQDPGREEPLVIARMTYASRAAADRSFASEAGVAAVEDVADFAPEGVAILHVTREQS